MRPFLMVALILGICTYGPLLRSRKSPLGRWQPTSQMVNRARTNHGCNVQIWNQRFQGRIICDFPVTRSHALCRTELDSFDIAQVHNLPGLPQVMAVLHGEPAFG
jgi:hypothetical protein